MTLLRNRYTWVAGLALAGVVLSAPAANAQRPFARFSNVGISRPLINIRPTNMFVRPFSVNFARFPSFNFARPPSFNSAFAQPFAPSFGFGQPFPVVQNLIPPFQPTLLQQSALQNWAFNTALIGRTYASFPPWLYGFNPYPPAFVGAYLPYSPGYAPTWGAYQPFVTPGFSPYLLPYLSAYSPFNQFGIPPITPSAAFSVGYNPYAVP